MYSPLTLPYFTLLRSKAYGQIALKKVRTPWNFMLFTSFYTVDKGAIKAKLRYLGLGYLNVDIVKEKRKKDL